MKAMALRYSNPDTATVAFLKVYSGVYDAVSPTPSMKIEKKGTGFVVIGLSLMDCFLLTQVVLLIVLWVTCGCKTKLLSEHHKNRPPHPSGGNL
ncbi:hypothetical protein SUGI_0715750 [Cryptomeria japonica]|nr:hypothetical protein SUGI_0715750 [Cryptomeria japonica]